MFDRLTEFFGQSPEREQDYRDFENRYRQDPNAISDEEAARRYRELIARTQEADEDDEAFSEYERAFSNLTEQERRDLAERYRSADADPSRSFDGFRPGETVEEASSPRELGRLTRRAAEKDPDLLDQLLGDSPLNSKGGRVAMAGVAAFLASRFLGRRR